MKEKVELFAKGVFSYDRPELITSVGNINISVEMGKVYRGSFSVSSSSDRPFKGLVYSTDGLVTFEKDSFTDVYNEINYTFDATHLDINDTVKGRITIVSEYGEAEIPFQAKVRVPSCETSIGPASDLFHFASLAQTDWAEAKNLFKSEEFRRTLSFYDPKFDNLYRSLLRSGNMSLALEELLCASRKKKQVGISCNKAEVSYENPESPFSDKIVLTKDTWGYSQLTVETEGDFIVAERPIIWTDDFNGNDYELNYSINPEGLHEGTNLGKIVISSVREKIEIPVIVKNSSADLKSRLSRRKMRHLEMKLMTNYLDYRLGRMSLAKLVAEEEKSLSNLRVFRRETTLDRLIRIWLQIENGHEAQAITALSVIFEDEEWGDDLILYSISLYLKARTEHESMAYELAGRLRDLYENNLDARIYLMCMHLDRKKRLGNNARFDALNRSVRGGQTSPITLLEACQIVNDEPTVLKSFSGFDLNVIRFGIRNKIINKNAMMHIAYLASREKNTSPIITDTLIKAYESFHISEILEALCIHLIKGEIHDETAFKWLSIGINEQLNVKDLYENCLMSAGIRPKEALPKAMLTYFENGISLPDPYKTAFYANVLRYRGTSEGISFILQQQMKDYALRQLSQGLIDDNLAVLYNNLLSPADLDEGMIAILPNIIFKNRIEINWKNAVAVLVAHKELESELLFEVKDGIAYADIFTEEPEVLAEDVHGNRIVPAEYTVNKLINNSELIRVCLDRCRDDGRVALNLLENARYRGDAEETISLITLCAERNDLEKKFEIECRRELIEYYYENLEGELMENLLVKTDLSVLGRRERARMIDLMILRELYSLAMKNMEMYGYSGVDVKRIAKLAGRLIETADAHLGTPLFTELCFLVFRKKKYDESILEYLVRYYNGDTESMYSLWQTAIDVGIETDDLEERLLGQILFTENDMSYSRDIFRRYYSRGSNRRLIKAFLSYYAYKYLVREHISEESMLELMRRETVHGENDLCTLAVLKAMSQQDSFTDSDRNYIESRMTALEQKGVVMPFFRNFGDGIHVPEGMQDKQYVEYHTDPRQRVRIHYCMLTGEDSEENYIDEDMKDLGYGIFVSEFVLFYGEVLQYYITEESNDSYVITESSELRIEPEMIGNEETGYHQLNLIITAKEMNDSKTMQKLLENYIRNEYISKNLFNPLL